MADVLAVRDEYRAQTWAMLIQECNMTKREFCQQRGISEKSFYYWLWKLRSQMAEATGPQLVQLDPISVAEDMLQLMAFLDYGDVPISNNLAENAIRLFVVGRKNWLFCDCVKGAEFSAIVYSLVETAKANGIEPYEYLMLVLSMLPYLGKSPAHEELEKLMPWHPAVRHREHIRK